jgi:polyisoprenoid-binding protein YceI
MKTTHLFIVAALSVPAAASAAGYDIDPAHSSAGFSVKHMMVSNLRGEFTKVTGAVDLDDQNLTAASIEAVIDAASITTGNSKRDEHLRSPEFFDVAKHANLTFKSTEVKRVGSGKYKVSGDLVMRGVSRKVVLDVEAPAAEVKDPYGNIKRGAVATTTINRKDFGLNWNTTLEAGGVLVGETVQVTIDLQLARKAPLKTATAR